MRGWIFHLLSLIVSVSLLLAFVPDAAISMVAQPLPASLAPVPMPSTLAAATAVDKLPVSTLPPNYSAAWHPILAPHEEEGKPPLLGEQAGRLGISDTHAAGTKLEWDDADSHKWIGEGWGADSPSGLTWGNFLGRDCLEIRWDYQAWLGYIRTDQFLDENWESPVIGIRADVYVVSEQDWTDIGIEPRDHSYNAIELLWGTAIDLTHGQWHTVSWYFTEVSDYHAVAGLVFKLDQLGNCNARVYLDNIRLITATGEEGWDDMDDGSRWWFYSGNWYNWSSGQSSLEPVSHNGRNPTTPAGSIYLQWDYTHGVYTGTTASVGTSRLEDRRDWSGYNRISADVKVSDPDVSISIFFWDAEGVVGFGTPTRKVGAADHWQTMVWDIPWPSWFDKTDIDEIKFIANNIDMHTTGTLYLDNIALMLDILPSPVTGLEYIFEDFNDRNRQFNDFNGNWGELNGIYITTTFATSTYTGTWGASLRVDYSLPSESFTGIWQSLWGHSDYTGTQHLDFTDIYGNLNSEAKDFEQIQFWVRGSGTTTGTHNIKIELKDNTDDFNHTAYRYITIDDSNTTWREVVLDTDVTNSSFWSCNLHPPDPTKMKFLVFVIESFCNNPTGTFYIDDIHFVDADDSPFILNQHTDDEFLDFVSQKTFLYFLDWYDPETGLVQDMSTSPDSMSTAAIGFGLTALAIGDARGWISHTMATEMVSRTLNTLYNGPQGPTGTGTMGYKGFFYHFLNTGGCRKDNSELSSVDTALLMAGVLTVREYFSETASIATLADNLYQRVEWDWMLDSGNQQFYLAWTPENGFSGHWDYYTDEAILINLLAIGSPTHPVSKEVFYSWARVWGECTDDSHIHRLIQSWTGSFFTYVFAHLWVDFSTLGKDNHPNSALQADWWENSVQAALCNWQFVMDHRDDTVCDGDDDYTTYGECSWGLTAAEGPDRRYHAYGAPPAAIPPDHDGTIAPYGAGMAIMFLPDKAICALQHYFTETDLWRYRFGFGDAYNLDPPDCNGPWYNHAAFGIDQGPMLISTENYRSGLIWTVIAGNSDISRALNMLFHQPTPTATPTSTPTPTATPPHTLTPMPTSTSTATVTYTPRPTATSTSTPTATRIKLYLPIIFKGYSGW